MIEFVPLGVLDSFIQNYHMGQALVVAFVLSVLGSFALSKKLLSLNVIVFGLLFLIVPSTISSTPYKMLGIALIVVGPILFTTARS